MPFILFTEALFFFFFWLPPHEFCNYSYCQRPRDLSSRTCVSGDTQSSSAGAWHQLRSRLSNCWSLRLTLLPWSSSPSTFPSLPLQYLSPLLLPQSFSLLNTLSPQHPHLGCVFSAVCSIFLPSPLHSQLPCGEGRSSWIPVKSCLGSERHAHWLNHQHNSAMCWSRPQFPHSSLFCFPPSKGPWTLKRGCRTRIWTACPGWLQGSDGPISCGFPPTTAGHTLKP